MKMRKQPTVGRLQQWMTLMELVIVLGILAVAASMTLPLFEDIEQRNRIRRTSETGQQIRNAVASGAYRRFVSDMGRLPDSFAELYHSPGDTFNVMTLVFAASAQHPEIILECGWNGPYVDPGCNTVLADPGATWKDAWGNPWEYLIDGTWTAEPGAGGIISGVRSLGSDGKVEDDGDSSGAWHAGDLVFLFPPVGLLEENELKTATLTMEMASRDPLTGVLSVVRADNFITSEIDNMMGAPAWIQDNAYAVGDYVRPQGESQEDPTLVFRCEKHVSNGNFGYSGESEPIWQTAANTVDEQLIWEPFTATFSGLVPEWQEKTIYFKGNVVRNTGGNNFRCFEVAIANRSGIVEPVWPQAGFHPYGIAVKDHQLTWRCVYPPPPQIMTGLSATLIQPFPGADGMTLDRVLLERESGDVLQEGERFSTFVFTGLTPGRRKLYVRGQLETAGERILNKRNSGILEIDLKPGENYLRVKLEYED